MADVVVAPVQSISNFLNEFFGFIGDYFGLLVAAIIIFILGIVIYMVLKKWEDEKKERDEPGFQVYNNLKRTCMLRAKDYKIRKTVAWGWFFFPPLFWMAWLLKKEHSNKLVNQFDNLIGYYRGECTSMDGSINYLVYKNKLMGLFESLFIVKIPIQLKLKKQVYNEKTGESIKGRFNAEIINLQQLIKELPNGDLKLQCTDIERLGQYYYCPVFVINERGVILDYRQILEGTIADNTYQAMVQRLLNVGARQMERGILLNPNLVYNQKLPEKTKEEERLEGLK